MVILSQNLYKMFCINWKHEELSGVGCTAGWASVDGKFVAGKTIDPGHDTVARVTGVATSLVTVQPIMFTSLELTGAVSSLSLCCGF